MRLLVCGDRDWCDYALVKEEIELFRMHVDNIETIIEGGAHGADFCGKMAGAELGIPVDEYPADWQNLGPKAGPIRNQRMVDDGKPDFVLAFHDDFEHSRGTKSMIKIAINAAIPYAVVKHETPWEPDVTVHPAPPQPTQGYPGVQVPVLPTRPKTYPRTPNPAPKPYVTPWKPADTPWTEYPKPEERRRYWSTTYGTPVREDIPPMISVGEDVSPAKLRQDLERKYKEIKYKA